MPLSEIGFGFGGPVDSATGVVTKSHQVSGWEGFPLGRWCRESLGKPAVIGNDCDVSALAEARLGAGAERIASSMSRWARASAADW